MVWTEELERPAFYRALAAEFLGTGFLVFIGCGAAVTSEPTQGTDSFVTRVALVFGLTVATIVWCIAAVSGGHINPAVTLAFVVTRKITIPRGVLYLVVQCLGAMTGAGFLYAISSARIRESAFGCNTLANDITVPQAILVEVLITFVLVFTVFATCDERRGDLRGSGPLAIGIAVLICHLSVIPFTGSSMNPARSLGPAMVRGGICWTDHYVYWIGPMIGGALGGWTYDFIFAGDASLRKVRHCLDCSRTQDLLEDVEDDDVKLAI